jgi:hypothetical protein
MQTNSLQFDKRSPASSTETLNDPEASAYLPQLTIVENTDASTTTRSTRISDPGNPMVGNFESSPKQEDYFMPQRKQQMGYACTTVQQNITARRAIIANRTHMQLKLLVDRKRRQVNHFKLLCFANILTCSRSFGFKSL